MRSVFAAGLLAACLLAPPAALAQSGDPQPVVVEGVVPDEAAKAEVLAKVREVYGAERVVDQIRIGPVVSPPNWSENVAKLVDPQLKQVSRGKLDINGNAVTISGQVVNELQRQQVASRLLNSLNSSYSVDADGLVVGGSPQTLIDDVLADRIIEFESGSDRLTPMGVQILDELVAPMKDSGAARIQIIGHTDNVGQRQANLALSHARAERVREYFSQHGVPAAGLSVIGRGPDEPVADNATADGRARNRRIEFKVL